MKKYLLLGILLILGGCASPDYNYRAELTEISEPPLDVVNVAYVGDVMLKQGKYSEHDAIYLPNVVEASWAFDLYPGYYLKQGEDHNSETYLPSDDVDGGRVDKAALADPWQAIMAYKDKPTLCVITIFSAMVCESNAQFERVKKAVLSSNSFQQTLIYSGKVGNKINIGYREFSNNHARPAFNNDVEYDLNSSNLIGYKGAKIEVIEASNEMIKYKVIRNFNKAVH
ncbi:hypothetical protein ABF107_004541 [Vibrio parahaemolyticus]|uniref:hypothetical protein n=1 Tax=Vibrio parahaemolyticus TaxID=670 RepID=UPI00159405B4|nr:hypothetical protein [Vibrio parahaemolyticus]EHK9087756.1 hypothetical protein [Vibrio parahaemolyticus]EJB1797685.1 hypothetical protein [Vibrio parahaemolyticus]NVC29520.1 hypothetical protein [Vibrio parahaemolyticus]HAS6943309.1 hypothetical protein [Vibrio parahaemolyticus]